MQFTTETREYLTCEILPLSYIKGWTYVRTIFSEIKFLGCIDNKIFLPMVLRFGHLKRESEADDNNNNNNNNNNSNNSNNNSNYSNNNRIIIIIIVIIITNNYNNNNAKIFITKPQLKSYLQSTYCYKKSNQFIKTLSTIPSLENKNNPSYNK